ncbi:MAG TPA: hypothetical protein VGX71_19120 [Pseudaminobacter sp.]|nr:hypothetical protein [Pseudaminobacter sp.]
MPRSRQRATLESGLKLDLYRLARRGFIQPGGYKRNGISWTNNYTGELIASGVITADMTDPFDGWFHIEIGSVSQRIILRSRPRHFGGRQWYYVCPRTNIRASVLWMPPGARTFACRKSWGRQVAYASQFLTEVDRAHRGKERIRLRLCTIGSLDPDEWEFPPKPKWMRWPTYRCAEEKFDRYEAALDWGCLETVARILGPDWFEKAS